MTIEEKAKEFATNAHKDQKRKYTNEPYIVHPAEVVEILRSIGADEEMLAAAWLHDVVEDCGVSINEIVDKFGINVGLMVRDLTDISKPEDGNRKVRKEIDRVHTAHASRDSKTIKLADLISNTPSIVKYDPQFAEIYLREKEDLLEVLTEGHPVLFAKAAQCILQN